MFDQKTLEKIQRSGQDWEQKLLKDYLEVHPERRDRFITDVGIEIGRLYTPLDVAQRGISYNEDLGFPGQAPFTRGITPSMYRSEPPMLRVYSGFGNPEQCNARYRKLVDWGAEEIVMAVDLPTQVGYDSNHVMSKGEIGRSGVAIDSLEDMEILFEGIPLNRLKRVSMLGNSIGPIALALFIALGEKQGLSKNDFVVDLQNDVIKEFIARGTQIFPVEPSIRFTTDAVRYCADHAPHWYPISVCVNHINAAGAGSTAGTAFALANAICYLEYMIARGEPIDRIAPLFSMFLDERENFFVAIANFRATRKIWARIMRDRFGAQDPRSMALKITAYGHGAETLQEPLNNIVRIAFGTLAYVLGGVQFLYNASFDETLNLPSEEAVRVAIRTQQIIAEELGFTQTVDPLGGSFFLETLTSQIEEQILGHLETVERIGGAIACIENGYFQRFITEGAVRRQQALERGERISVTVNKFRSQDDIPSAYFYIDPKIEQAQVERLKKLRKSRDNQKVQKALSDIREVAEGDDNLVIPILEAVRNYATIGEICDTLRPVFGECEPDREF